MTSGAKKQPPSAPRSAARLASVQALYQMDIANTNLKDIVHEFTLYRFAQEEGEKGTVTPDATFFTELLQGVVRRQWEIDPVVDDQLATGWRLVRIDSIVRAILRAALFELIDRPDVPVKVVINEYINIAHAFFDQDEPRVVNAILHNLAARYRPGEIKKAPVPSD